MYHTTGLPAEAITVLYQTLVHNYPRTPQAAGRPPALSQAEEIRATLAYLRRNRAQAELAESFGVSQASICRAIARWTARIVEVLAELVPTADDLDQDQTLIVDGTLVPCWDWKDQPGLYSGKHHRTGLNLQVACTLTGRLVWVSDPAPGSTHDAKAIQSTGFLDNFPDMPPLGDKGYTGLGMMTPIRKPPGGGLTGWQKQYNHAINKLRAPVERAIAHLKTWRILHAGYRRPLDTFPQTITAVIALEFYKNSFE
ncbi:transposase family protein [Propionibacterium australiense]|uniref:transposase family protein n=1 Tax=Propionibacterium australiense TaxID=119981 RepID=UPI001C7E0058|nr:transposase family protein [Propionibacterium australiense]